MEIPCRDGISGLSQCLEVRRETASQLLTRVCELFEREEDEDTALEMDGEVVWVSGWDAAEVAVSSLSLRDIVLRRSLERVLTLARNGRTQSDLPKWAWAERSVVLAAVGVRGLALRHASAGLQDDHEVVSRAVRAYGPSLEYASSRLRDDRDVVTIAIRRNKSALEWASSRLQDELSNNSPA